MLQWQAQMSLRRPRGGRYLGVLGALAIVLGSITASAQDQYTPIRRLGTSNAISRPGPQTGEELRQVFRSNRDAYLKVLQDAGWPGDPEDVFRAVENGQFSEARYPVGHTFEWMAVRKNGVAQPTGPIRWAGDAPFDAFEIRVESNGMEHRFLIPKACGNLSLIETRDIQPQINIADFVPNLRVQAPNQCTGVNVTVDVTVSGGLSEQTTLDLTMTRPDGRRETLSPTAAGGGYRWTGQLDDAGTYIFAAVVNTPVGPTEQRTERINIEPCPPTCSIQLDRPPMDPAPRAGRASIGVDMCQSSAQVGELASRTVRIHHTPEDGPEQLVETLSLDTECRADYLLAEYGRYRFEAEVTDDRGLNASCQADYSLGRPPRRLEPFFTLFVGNERRWRPGIEDDVLATADPVAIANNADFLFDRSAPLAGGTLGISYPFSEGAFSVFGQGGVAGNLRDSDNTSIFADVGIDRNFEGGFIGGGIGIWDINHSDTRDGTIFVHGGFDITERLQFNLEGRLFMDMLDMIDNNYIYLGGIRYFWTRER